MSVPLEWYRVEGDSMRPTLEPGTLLLVRRIPASRIRPGDLVLFLRRGRAVAHRVRARACAGGPHLLLEGPENGSRGTVVPEEAVLGRAERLWDGSRLRPIGPPARPAGPPSKALFFLHALLRTVAGRWR